MWKFTATAIALISFTPSLRVNNRSRERRTGQDISTVLWPPSRTCTGSTLAPQPKRKKTGFLSGKVCGSRDSSAQLLRHFIEQPVQILVILSALVNLLDRMQNRSVMFAAELPADLGEGSFSQVLGQIHRDLAR